MDRIKLEKDIQEIELKLSEMKKALAEEEKQFPQKGDTYFFVTPNGELDEEKASDSNGRFQVFRTEKDAEKFYEVECAKKRVKDAIKKLNDGWTPDWKTNIESKCLIVLANNKLDIECYRNTKKMESYMYLKNMNLAYKLIENYKDDLLLILGQ